MAEMYMAFTASPAAEIERSLVASLGQQVPHGWRLENPADITCRVLVDPSGARHVLSMSVRLDLLHPHGQRPSHRSPLDDPNRESRLAEIREAMATEPAAVLPLTRSTAPEATP